MIADVRMLTEIGTRFSWTVFCASYHSKESYVVFVRAVPGLWF